MSGENQPVALVTGSGRGIGRAIAEVLARDGFFVVVNALRPEGAEETRRAIFARGGRAEVRLADVSDRAQRQALLSFIDETCGRLDLLVNNAGIAPAVRADLLAAGEESFDRLLSINLKGPYFLTQEVARRMIAWKAEGKTPRPRIAFISSISAYAVSTDRGDYCVSKAGLSMAAQLFAARLAEYDIPVIEIRPGVIQTDMTAGVKEKYDRLIAEGLLPTRRWGRPEDVARAVAAFARGDLDYSTGAAIDVSGGFNLRRL
ncbi:3-ketoacyl-ACP reductase [bacterium]|nr:3-ketoacyl-ACP reductase [bacterium]